MAEPDSTQPDGDQALGDQAAGKLGRLIEDGVQKLCADECKARKLPADAGDDVSKAFLDQRHVPEVDRLAAKQAIAAALRSRGASTEWAEDQAGTAAEDANTVENRRIVGIARALAVAYALDDQNSSMYPGVASAGATRDRQIALRYLQGALLEDGVRDFVKGHGDFLIKVSTPEPTAWRLLRGVVRWANALVRGATRWVETLVNAAATILATVSGTEAEPPVLNPDPWWVPEHVAGKPAASRMEVPDEARTALLTSLLTVYSTQFGSYTSLLWQVPALGLTAQAFLLTIALTNNNGDLAKVIASVLSILIAVASSRLMHDQRGHAINHGELALRVSRELRLASQFGTLNVDDAEPTGTNAETVWVSWDHRIYGVWRTTLMLFLVADLSVLVYLILAAVFHWH